MDRDIDVFKQKYYEVNMNPDEITYKINFVQHGKSLMGGNFNGVCYVHEKAGSFTLLSVHNNKGHTNEIKKSDIIRPGK